MRPVSPPVRGPIVSYTNPAGAETASIKLAASDAQGNTLNQIIHRAYAVITH